LSREFATSEKLFPPRLACLTVPHVSLPRLVLALLAIAPALAPALLHLPRALVLARILLAIALALHDVEIALALDLDVALALALDIVLDLDIALLALDLDLALALALHLGLALQDVPSSSPSRLAPSRAPLLRRPSLSFGR
jgi:hypothetical protein